ncbi:MAG: hypothetical protein ACXVFO_09285 [Solirubrobacteraceae bacterium]
MDEPSAATSPITSLPVPRALDGPEPQRRFSPGAMRRRLRVLFIVSQPTASPAISVHATPWRSLDPERVEVHVLYNRRAADEPPGPVGPDGAPRLRGAGQVRAPRGHRPDPR